MKKELKIILVIGLVVVMFGVAQPTLLYAGGGTTGGNLWDPFVNTNPLRKPFTEIKGTLNIIFNPGYLADASGACNNFLGSATMFYSVRLIYGGNLYANEGSTGVCYGNIGVPGSGGWGDVISTFLVSSIQSIIPFTKWNIKTMSNPVISGDGFSFITDLTIQVK
jgi:hypothetical protein